MTDVDTSRTTYHVNHLVLGVVAAQARGLPVQSGRFCLLEGYLVNHHLYLLAGYV